MKLRMTFGSHPEVRRVFAYDPLYGRACVLLVSAHGDRDVIDCVSLGDLEALDAEGRYGDVKAELARRAGYVLAEEFA